MSPARSAIGVALAALLGALLGAFSALGDGVHVMVINGLANATGPWVVTAFVAGVLQRDMAIGAAAGALALLTATATYYSGFLVSGYDFLLPFLLTWSAAAVASGAVFGFGGGVWAIRRDRWRAAAVVLVSGALIAEAAHRLILLEVWTGIEWDRTFMHVAIADVVAAIALVLFLVDRRTWLSSLAALPPAAGAWLVVLVVGDNLIR
jgi:Family of unknown function (DUF6518)